MAELPSEGDMPRRDWNAWATLANNVSEALNVLGERPRFSERQAVAKELWRMGYRPTVEQIEAEVARGRGSGA